MKLTEKIKQMVAPKFYDESEYHKALIELDRVVLRFNLYRAKHPIFFKRFVTNTNLKNLETGEIVTLLKSIEKEVKDNGKIPGEHVRAEVEQAFPYQYEVGTFEHGMIDHYVSDYCGTILNMLRELPRFKERYEDFMGIDYISIDADGAHRSDKAESLLKKHYSFKSDGKDSKEILFDKEKWQKDVNLLQSLVNQTKKYGAQLKELGVSLTAVNALSISEENNMPKYFHKIANIKARQNVGESSLDFLSGSEYETQIKAESSRLILEYKNAFTILMLLKQLRVDGICGLVNGEVFTPNFLQFEPKDNTVTFSDNCNNLLRELNAEWTHNEEQNKVLNVVPDIVEFATKMEKLGITMRTVSAVYHAKATDESQVMKGYSNQFLSYMHSLK